MKVLFVLNVTDMSGNAISFVTMLRGLHEKGISCYVVAPDKEAAPLFQEATKGLIEKYYYVPLVWYVHDDPRAYHGYRKFKKVAKYLLYHNHLRRKRHIAREAREMARIVDEVQPDLIHTNASVIQAGYKIAKKRGIPHVWHIREYQTKDFLFAIEPSYRALVRMLKTDYVISITKDILKYFQLDHSARAKCIYNGCFSKKDKLPAQFPKEEYFLCCSRVSEEKGHRDVVRAFAKFHANHPTYRLVIAGFGSEYFIQVLKTMAEEAHCLDAIDFIGFQKDVKPWMRKAKALIVASRFEGFGRMTAEAAFYGCPVIGRNTGGTKEVLDITGGFPYMGDAEVLWQKMEEVAALPEEDCKALVDRAQAQAITHFSAEAYVEQVYEMYQDALRENIRALGGGRRSNVFVRPFAMPIAISFEEEVAA